MTALAEAPWLEICAADTPWVEAAETVGIRFRKIFVDNSRSVAVVFCGQKAGPILDVQARMFGASFWPNSGNDNGFV